EEGVGVYNDVTVTLTASRLDGMLDGGEEGLDRRGAKVKVATAAAVIASASDGPIPIGEIVGVILILNALMEEGNPNYPGPWTTTKPDPTIPFYGPAGNSSYRPPNPEEFPPDVDPLVGGTLIGL